MSTPLLCLIAYALWTILLVSLVATSRAVQVLTGKKAANAFPSGMQHGGDAYWRLNRAHLNAAENLAIFASIVLVGALAKVDSSSFATLAQVVVGARVVQSVVHIASGSVLAVNVRFSAFCVQLGCLLAMALEILRAS